ncbi:MAG: thiamine phosphate synthase [Acidobacteriota bacterium]|jgi:thiamine-phosphate pyrophosphorylase
MKLPRLYPIADWASLNARGISVGEFALEMAQAGVGVLQYRDKLRSKEEILGAAGEIAAQFAGRDCLLIMNDHPELARDLGWGVHVGHMDVSPDVVRQMMGGRACVIGVSTNDEAQMMAANAGSADYVAVGPVFATASKADAEPAVGLEGVRRARAMTSKPLVAIGGITQVNAAGVIAAGADSVAVIGALLAPGRAPGRLAVELLSELERV